MRITAEKSTDPDQKTKGSTAKIVGNSGYGKVGLSLKIESFYFNF